MIRIGSFCSLPPWPLTPFLTYPHVRGGRVSGPPVTPPRPSRAGPLPRGPSYEIDGPIPSRWSHRLDVDRAPLPSPYGPRASVTHVYEGMMQPEPTGPCACIPVTSMCYTGIIDTIPVKFGVRSTSRSYVPSPPGTHSDARDTHNSIRITASRVHAT